MIYKKTIYSQPGVSIYELVRYKEYYTAMK